MSRAPLFVFLERDWDNKGVVLRCFEAIATILLNCATRPSLSRQKWLSFFKVVKRCPCRAVQLHEGRVCRCKAVKTTSWPFKLLPVGFVIGFFFRKKHLSLLDLSHFWSQEMSLQLHEEEEVCSARLQSRRPWDRRPSNSQACKLQAGTSPPWGAVSERNKMIAMVWMLTYREWCIFEI